ncbi:hypothetical protein BDV38DRAFT_84202 [Aspergillus pseudotamarii]|uniref:Uncharacterized protein n=1 Tax=Aspergillus pseudotamarii TaxID=132259 RepID=A0A5N6ST79_ASPPS|nr:uncharacterized protein BDV38DRAFT_84202 [Aspergillus pseudotamarii]KAE8137845.1 hypothetical protein BDV38DRAFT_84202 [Aspergillus pseudotamarii]
MREVGGSIPLKSIILFSFYFFDFPHCFRFCLFVLSYRWEGIQVLFMIYPYLFSMPSLILFISSHLRLPTLPRRDSFQLHHDEYFISPLFLHIYHNRFFITRTRKLHMDKTIFNRSIAIQRLKLS